MMAEITIFSTPKPFTDPFIATIQRNAIRSWTKLGSEVEVVLLGDEPGMAQVIEAFGIRHIPQVECNEWGTPLVRSLFERVGEVSRTPLLSLVNADIILMDDFVQAALAVKRQAQNFLMVGRRWGLNVDAPLDFGEGWEGDLRDEINRRGMLHPKFSIDYFVFPRGQYEQMPDFVIGRPQWDNWMIYHTRSMGWPVVDATESVLAVHQNHDYRHLPGNQPPHGLEEGRRNRQYAGGWRAKYTILDANRALVDGRLARPPFSLERALRSVETWLMQRRWKGIEWRIFRRLRKLRRAWGESLPEGWVAGGWVKEDEPAAQSEEQS
jgi:hypothetical protein